MAPFNYREPLKELHHRFKFRNDLAAGDLLAMLLSDTLVHCNPLPQLLMPIPLHAGRMRQRGFDQALEIAKPVARRLLIPLATGALERSRSTAPQSGLNRRQRERNISKAFALRQPVNVKHVALIDDVMTTGSTFNAAAKLLKKNGVKRVDIWAVARSLRER